MKRYFLILSLLVCNSFFSQNKSFIYELSFKPNEKKDSLAKENFVLDINADQSFFRSVEDKKQDSLASSLNQRNRMTTSFKDFLAVSKDFKTNETKKYITNFQKLFTITIDEILVWKIENETKQYLDFRTQRATTNYGGRKWIAWFTNDIPLQEGPYIFQGLPGIITEIVDEENNYHFSLVQIKNYSGDMFNKAKALPITWKQFDKLALDYFADPTREINGKNTGDQQFKIKWVDDQGNEFAPNFKEMNEVEQKKIKDNNNPIEINKKVKYP